MQDMEEYNQDDFDQQELDQQNGQELWAIEEKTPSAASGTDDFAEGQDGQEAPVDDGLAGDIGPEITTSAVIEAVLFATDEPITPNKLAEIVGTCGIKQIGEYIDSLNHRYEEMKCAFRIEAIAGGYQMLTQGMFNPWLRKLIKVRSETKLSPAALETLAIISYKQPIMRVDVEAIRGVGAGEMIRQLIEKGLVKIVGRAEEIGRPLLYGTTRKFLEVFGLNSLKDLPTVEDLKKPQ